MHKTENYSLIMLDINSTNIDIKLNALDKISSSTEKERYIPALEKIAQAEGFIITESMREDETVTDEEQA